MSREILHWRKMLKPCYNSYNNNFTKKVLCTVLAETVYYNLSTTYHLQYFEIFAVLGKPITVFFTKKNISIPKG